MAAGLGLAVLLVFLPPTTLMRSARAADQAQVARGGQVYSTSCAACHAVALTGGVGPSLLAPGLANRFRTALDLYGIVRTTMPFGQPGSLSDGEYMDVVAYLLEQRGLDHEGPLSLANAAAVLLAGQQPSATPTAPPVLTIAASTPTPSPVPTAVAGASGNSPPSKPQIWEPAEEAVRTEVSPYFMQFQTSPFEDPNPGDSHLETQFEVWDIVRNVRVWSANATDPVDEASLLTGTFEGPLAGKLGLEQKTIYRIRARHRDDSRVLESEWSEWSEWVTLLTRQQGMPAPSPMRIRDIAAGSLEWFASDGKAAVLPPGSSMSLTGGLSNLYLIQGSPGGNREQDFQPAGRHVDLYLHFRAGEAELVVPESTLSFLDGTGVRRTIWVPYMSLSGGRFLTAAASAEGDFYFEPDATPIGQADSRPILITRARIAESTWRVRPGFRLELVAADLQLPVQFAFAANPAAGPGAPFIYVTELLGRIRVISRDGVTGTYAEDILNLSEERPKALLELQVGVSGIAVDPQTGDVYAATVYEDGESLHNKIVRFESDDGGRTAARSADILRMASEPSGWSHQVHGLILGLDGYLYAAVGDAMVRGRGLDDR